METSGDAEIYSLRGDKYERQRREDRGAVGAETETPTKGSGEHRKLPQRGPGQSAGRKRFYCFLGVIEHLSL